MLFLSVRPLQNFSPFLPCFRCLMKHPSVITSSISQEKTACFMIALYSVGQFKDALLAYLLKPSFPLISLLKAIFISHFIALRKASADPVRLRCSFQFVTRKKIKFKFDYFDKNIFLHVCSHLSLSLVHYSSTLSPSTVIFIFAAYIIHNSCCTGITAIQTIAIFSPSGWLSKS